MRSCAGGCCGGAVGGIDQYWTFWSLVGAFVDLALAYAFLCTAAAASASSRLLSLVGLKLPCTCGRPNLGCLHSFLAGYPSRTIAFLLLSLRSRWPFLPSQQPHPDGQFDHNEEDDDDDHDNDREDKPLGLRCRRRRTETAARLDGAEVKTAEGLDLRRALDEERAARAALQRELEKERSAAASAAEEAMAMILRLQKEKSALEIEARQQRRTADERSAYYEEEVEDLKDIILLREREAHALQKEVEAYQHLLRIGAPNDDDEMAQHVVDCKPSSSVGPLLLDDNGIVLHRIDGYVEKKGENDGAVQLASDTGFSFQIGYLHENFGSPLLSNHIKETNRLADKPLAKAPLIVSKSEAEFSDDDGSETVEIQPLSLQSKALNQCSEQQHDDQDDIAAGKVAMKGLPSDEFQGEDYKDIDKMDHDLAGIGNDAHVYDVHVVDDISCLTDDRNAKGILRNITESIELSTVDQSLCNAVTGLIRKIQSFSDATKQTIPAERLENKTAVDDLLRNRLNVIQGGREKLSFPACEMEQSLQLQLLEEIANELQEIKNATEAGQHLRSATPKNSKDSHRS